MSMIVKWRSTAYLNEANYSPNPQRTQALQACLESTGVVEKLKTYLPILVGPHALGVDASTDTVTFFCEVYALDNFRAACESGFEDFAYFQIVEKNLNDREGIWLRFQYRQSPDQAPWHFEIIGQPVPVEEQPCFQLLASADRLIRLYDDPLQLKNEIANRRQAFVEANKDQEAPDYAETLISVLGLKTGGASATDYLIDLLDMDDNGLQALLEGKSPTTASAA